jgi:hypothetical protein
VNYIGIDNGVSGSVAIIDESGSLKDFFPTPVFRDLNYTKKKAWVNRVDTMLLAEFLYKFKEDSTVALERPMVNPGRFNATVSALRALEATLIVLEGNKIPYKFIDSKEWQKTMLPSGLQGEELKWASNAVCKRLFPDTEVKRPGDGDSILIAEYLRRTA